MKKTEFRSSAALKTQVEFAIPEVEFGPFDTEIRFRAPVAQACANRAPPAVDSGCEEVKKPSSAPILFSQYRCAPAFGHCVSICLAARFSSSQHGFPHRFPGHTGVFNVFHNIQRGIHRSHGGMNLIERRFPPWGRFPHS